MVKGKQNKDKTIRVQPIAFFFGGTPGGAVKCIVRRRTGAPTKVVQHPDVDDVEPGLDVESEAECEGEEGERQCATSGDGAGPSDQPPRADTPLTDAWMAEEERVAAERVAERAAAERAASGVGAGTSGDQPPPPRAGTTKKPAGMGDTFRHIWLERDWAKTKDGKVWLEEVKGHAFHAFCNLCSKYMNAPADAAAGAEPPAAHQTWGRRVCSVLGRLCSGGGVETQDRAIELRQAPEEPVVAPLGIADPALLARVLTETTHVIHCAASIVLEEHIHTTLLQNYCGTRALLSLATRMARLRSFTHVSSTYANSDAKVGATVYERVYPLMLGDCEIDQQSQVALLMAGEPNAASAKARTLRQLLGLANNYILGKRLTELMKARSLRQLLGLANKFILGKRLTELMVRDTAPLVPFPVAIVRPSFVGALTASGPCPGYTGNLAGPAGLALAYGMGFYVKGSAAWHSDRGMDAVPGDIASSLVLAAAAAATTEHEWAGSGLGGGGGGGGAAGGSGFKILGPQQAGSMERGGARAPRAPREARDPAGAPLSRAGSGPPLSLPVLHEEGTGEGGQRGAQQAPSAVVRSPGSRVLVVHAASQTVNPIANWEVMWIAYDYFSRNPLDFKLFAGKTMSPLDFGYPPDHLNIPDEAVVEKAKAKVARRVRLVAGFLDLIGQSRAASRLRIGFQQWREANVVKADMLHYFSVSTTRALETALVLEERADFPLVWRGDWHAYSQTYLDWVVARYAPSMRKRRAK
ncbi:hypothetical protein FOA52_007187 [Chlamydomonas sp. UWO 241]|nr:hypothetical protein FOA52_007187 [Chlamydomonas sp. UWO 241]